MTDSHSPLCPSNCGFPMDLQKRTPAVWWCGWCMQYFDADLKLMSGSNPQPKRPHPSVLRAQEEAAKGAKGGKDKTPLRIAPPVDANGFAYEEPED